MPCDNGKLICFLLREACKTSQNVKDLAVAFNICVQALVKQKQDAAMTGSEIDEYKEKLFSEIDQQAKKIRAIEEEVTCLEVMLMQR